MGLISTLTSDRNKQGAYTVMSATGDEIDVRLFQIRESNYKLQQTFSLICAYDYQWHIYVIHMLILSAPLFIKLTKALYTFTKLQKHWCILHI